MDQHPVPQDIAEGLYLALAIMLNGNGSGSWEVDAAIERYENLRGERDMTRARSRLQKIVET